ncbi:MAG: tRNA 2-selenouridine(34) synthase MnmH [Prochlorothrix sp.]|nr:tRNA 2-selenouridine(34) synthase MnmH [Prochlorothrix sp.]
MPSSLSVPEFLNHPGVVVDVRSPGEFNQGHLPGAVNLPLFSDGERAEVGTCYKQVGPEAAMDLGLRLVGPKLGDWVAQARHLSSGTPLRIHCWRGGMRSQSLGGLLETLGFAVVVLHGGYKAYRAQVRRVLAEPRSIRMVGGMTGTGKTEVLLALASLGEQVLDLEGLANHRGSSYGNLGLPPQPTTEQYENEIAAQWVQFEAQRPLWIEAESRQVGTCRIPPEVFEQMEAAPVWELLRDRADRVALLARVYGEADRSGLLTATERIRKRLGGLRTQQALDHIAEDDLEPAIALVLDYYDQTYRYDLDRRSVPRYPVEVTGRSALEAAQMLQQAASQSCPGA